MDNNLIRANAGTPKAKYVTANDVLLISLVSKAPYPNKQVTISLLAINKPSDAGTDNNN